MTRFPSLIGSFVAVLLSLASPAHAADKTWTGGGATRLMSEGANWIGGVPPARGDRLIFPQSNQTYVQNDLADASFDSLFFYGGTSIFGSAYSLYGNAMSLTGAQTVTVTGPIVVFITLDIAFPSQYVRFWTTGSAYPGYNLPALQFSYGQLQFSGGLLEITAEVGDIAIGASITETAPTSIQTDGINVAFAGNSSFSGTMESLGGSFGISAANALGSPAGATYLRGDSSLDIYNPALGGPEMVVPEPFVFENAPDVSTFGSILAISAGPIRLTGDIAVLTPQVIQANVPLSFDGLVSGSGHVQVGLGLSDGTVTFTNGGNTFDGGITVSRGTLQAGNSLALGFLNSLDVESVAALDLGYTFQALTQFTCRGGRVHAVIGAAELSVRDSVTLAGCALVPAMWPGFIPQSGQVLTVIRNGSGAPLQGEFDFFGEGTVLDVNGVRTTATYHAGSGNDFAFVAEVLPAVELRAWGGALQSLELGTRSLVPLSVQAFDRFGRPATNARVVFTAPPGCGTFNGSQSVTATVSATGFATAPAAFTAGNQSQVCFVQAQGDSGAAASFEFHLYAAADVVITPVPATLSTVVNQPFTVAAEVRGLNGMSLPNLSVTFENVLRGNSGAIGLPRSVFTLPTSSRVAVSLTANEKSGNYDIAVRVGTTSIRIPVSQKAH